MQTQLVQTHGGPVAIVAKHQTKLNQDAKRFQSLQRKRRQLETKLRKLNNVKNKRFHTLIVFRALSLPEILYDWFRTLSIQVNVTSEEADSPTYRRYEVDIQVGGFSCTGDASYEMSDLKITLPYYPFTLDWDHITNNMSNWAVQFLGTQRPTCNLIYLIDPLDSVFDHHEIEKNWFMLQIKGVDMSAVVFFMLLHGLAAATDADVEITRAPWKCANLMV